VSGLRLVLVRHGITDWNREGRFQGHLDPPLSDVGLREAMLTGQRLAAEPDLRPERIVSSSLERAFQTAAAIGEVLGLPVERDRRLMEIGQGEWEGRTHAELEETDGDRYRAWRDAVGIRQPPGGEPVDAAVARVAAILDDVTSGEASPVCLVSHGGTLRILARRSTTCRPIGRGRSTWTTRPSRWRPERTAGRGASTAGTTRGICSASRRFTWMSPRAARSPSEPQPSRRVRRCSQRRMARPMSGMRSVADALSSVCAAKALIVRPE
jgi:broad specificity phosphatase PhoE